MADARRTAGVAAVPAAGMRRVFRVAQVSLVVVLIAGYALISHLVSIAPPPAGFGTVLFAVLPLLAVIMAIGWHAHRWLALAVCAVVAIALWHQADQIGRHVPMVYLLQNVSTNAALMVIFGASLRHGHVPLVSRFAAMVRGSPLAPAIERYTRRVTLAWTLFFATMIVASVGLHVTTPVEVWSVFANLLMLPLIGMMFVVEYAIRRRVLRDFPHSPISASIRLWLDAGAASERLRAPLR